MNEELERVKALLKSESIDVALICGEIGVTYVSGFELPARIGVLNDLMAGPMLALISQNDEEACLLVSSMDYEPAMRANRLKHLHVYKVSDHFAPLDARQSYLNEIKEMFGKCNSISKGNATIGVEFSKIPLCVMALIKEIYPNAKVLDISDILVKARLTKTKREIELIRECVKLNDVGQKALLELAEPGLSEIALSNEVIKRIRVAAGREVACSIDMAAGGRTAINSYPMGPVARDLEKGDMVIYDLSVRYKGYWSDTTNTFVVGANPTKEQLRYFNAVKDAFDALVSVIKPGVRACDVNEAAKEAFAAHGMPLAHYSGHQVGICVNDVPKLVCYDETKLLEGMVFSLEPGAYAGVNGNCGVRLEKVVLVTPDGAEILSKFDWGINSEGR